MSASAARFLPRSELGAVFGTLRDAGYEVVGPTVRDGAVVYDTLSGPEDLPVGWTDEQAPGRYRLARRADDRVFGYAVGPHSWKQQLFPAREPLWTGTRGAGGEVAYFPAIARRVRKAFLGVRACELAAMELQDRVFVRGPYVEPRYVARRRDALILAVECTDPGELCFCASLDTGPAVGAGADVVFVERDDGFLLRAGSPKGAAWVATLPTREADQAEVAAATDAVAACASKMGRTFDTSGLPGLLLANRDHPRWDDVASRCLACGACTSVCPTCFCSTAQSASNLDGSEGSHDRLWDSCFSPDHARIHGAQFRPTTRDRYRQWLTHKVDTWVAQFGASGCVGCGRCIAWCPSGIDLRAEVAAIREGAAPPAPPPAVSPPVAQAEPDALLPRVATVISAVRETADVVTLAVRAEGIEVCDPGQFTMIGLPAVGEVPISVSRVDGPVLSHTVRAVGAVTEALCRLRPGEKLGIRGPFGRPWPLGDLRGAPVVVVAGGIGLAPLMQAIREMAADPVGFYDVRVFVGARTPGELLFTPELLALPPQLRVTRTVDRGEEGWGGHVGVVTRLLRGDAVPADAVALVCGPEPMMKYTVLALKAAGLPESRIWVTMERHMKCAAGFCGRCQYAHWFLCKDGPVFRYDELATVFGHDGF